MQLGDYRGGRENLTQIMGLEIPQLANINKAALTFGSQAAQSVFGRGQDRQRIGDMLNATLAAKMFDANNMSGQADMLMEAKEGIAEQADQDAADAVAGEESAANDWMDNVLNSYDPESPEYKQVLRTKEMMRNRKRGSASFNKAYMGHLTGHGITEPASQGALGAAAWVPKQQAQKPTTAESKKPTYNNGNYAGVDGEYHE